MQKSSLVKIREEMNVPSAFSENLGFVWKKLEFHVETFHNLTETGISRTLAHYAFRVDHTNFDCFVCCVLTHGK